MFLLYYTSMYHIKHNNLAVPVSNTITLLFQFCLVQPLIQINIPIRSCARILSTITTLKFCTFIRGQYQVIHPRKTAVTFIPMEII